MLESIAEDRNSWEGSPVKGILWNVEWAESNSPRGRRIAELIRDPRPDVVCLTEGTPGLLPEGHIISAGADYGYPNPGHRRKVLLWSRSPWEDVDPCGCPSLPPGRFVSGVTGGIRFIGVCIPWKDAHVRTGRRDRIAWQEHLLFLDGLAKILDRADERPVCLLGDFNQRQPATRQPAPVAHALTRTLGARLTLATAGIRDAEGSLLIDHIAASPQLSVDLEALFPKSDGLRLSDHVGIRFRLSPDSG